MFHFGKDTSEGLEFMTSYTKNNVKDSANEVHTHFSFTEALAEMKKFLSFSFMPLFDLTEHFYLYFLKKISPFRRQLVC
jgi:hypothetical protein